MTARLTEELRGGLVEHIKNMIEEVMGEQDIWRIIDEHVQEEYARSGDAWLDVLRGPEVLCCIGSGDAVFTLPLDVDCVDVDSPDAPQDDNRKRAMHLDVLIEALKKKRQELSAAIGKHGAK